MGLLADLSSPAKLPRKPGDCLSSLETLALNLGKLARDASLRSPSLRGRAGNPNIVAPSGTSRVIPACTVTFTSSPISS